MKKFILYLVILANSLATLGQGTIPVQMNISKGNLADTPYVKAKLFELNTKILSRWDSNTIKLKLAAIPKGLKGDPGPQGPQGIQGIQGPPGPAGTGTGTGGISLISMVSVKDFGAKGDGSTDDAQAINNAVQYCYANQVYTLYFPPGRYKVSKPILLRNKNSAFSTIRLLGETRQWSSSQGSVIIATFNDAPIIGIQLNKGSEINGFNIVGTFQPQAGSTFFSTPFEKWGTGARDSRYSPQCGIGIDYATNFGGVPADGGYPTLTSEYGIFPDRGTGGSTGVQIRNCVINNCVVGIASSVNGQTQNEEELTIDFVDFTNCKTAVAGGQAQEKNNVLSNFATWGGTHTVFSQGVYGSPGHAGNWVITKGNLAGAVVQIVQSWAAAWFPTFIDHVFAESLGRFGSMGTQMNAHVTNCHFDFQEPQYGVGYQPVVSAWGLVNFDNCIFRFYNGAVPGYPMVISGGVYNNCTFGGTPIDISDKAEYYNCIEDGYGVSARKIGDVRKNIPLTPGENIVTHNRYGDFSVSDGYSNPNPTTLLIQSSKTYIKFSVENGTRQINTTAGAAFTFVSDNSAAYFINQLIEYRGDTGVGWGIVSSIAGNVVTILAGTPANAGFSITGIYPNHASISFTGDITGPNEISNVKMKWGIPSGGVGGAFQYGVSGFIIISYDAATNKFKTIGQLPQFTSYLFK